MNLCQPPYIVIFIMIIFYDNDINKKSSYSDKLWIQLVPSIFFLQIGQVLATFAHVSKQLLWKTCFFEQGNTITFSSSTNLWKQIGQDPSLSSIILLVIYTSSGNWTGSTFLFRLKQQHATSRKINNKTGERTINKSIRIKNQIFKDSRNKRVITTPFSNEV